MLTADFPLRILFQPAVDDFDGLFQVVVSPQKRMGPAVVPKGRVDENLQKEGRGHG